MSEESVTETLTNTTHIYDTYDYFIHPHWKRFPPVSDSWHYFDGIFIGLVGITGVIGNILVIWMFTTNKKLKTPSNMLIVNLALSDLTFSAINGFPLKSISAFSKRWVFGIVACELYGLIGGIFGFMSIGSLAAISIDRFICITKPLQAARIMTRKKAFIMIVIVWLWSVLWAIPPLFGFGAYIPEGFQTSCTFDYISKTTKNRYFIIGLYVFGFLMPFLVIICCYIMILKAIKAHGREMTRMAGKLNAEEADKNKKAKAEMKIAKIALMLVSLFILSWSPYATIALVAQFGSADFVTPLMCELPVLLAKTSAMHNPLVYALSHPRFRAALAEKAPCFMACCPLEKTPTSTLSRHVAGRTASQSSATSCATNLSDCQGGIQMQPTPTASINHGDLVKDLVGALVNMATQNGPHVVPSIYLPNGTVNSSGIVPAPQVNVISGVGHQNPAFVHEVETVESPDNKKEKENVSSKDAVKA
ncbi:rhodopsin, GQ-coupled-like [Ylistrum balloti]|uniref:rhodopsin, GQ-coupled-like n=1 Tax=Ylistrum balloti TaxID=509963 RepID=UPI002905AEB0|nr:rhodopsin, GQ-coupled-like [Ylistrum balloti]